MPARRKKAAELCGECFPGGLAGQPADATQVSCAHGSWDVEPRTAEPKDPGGVVLTVGGEQVGGGAEQDGE